MLHNLLLLLGLGAIYGVNYNFQYINFMFFLSKLTKHCLNLFTLFYHKFYNHQKKFADYSQ